MGYKSVADITGLSSFV